MTQNLSQAHRATNAPLPHAKRPPPGGYVLTPKSSIWILRFRLLPKALIALDKEWAEAGGDAAKLDKIIGDSALAIGPKGEAQDKQQLIASNKAASTDLTTATYTADEYKFDMPSSDVVVMTHRGTTKGMQNGTEVTESHRSRTYFRSRMAGGR